MDENFGIKTSRNQHRTCFTNVTIAEMVATSTSMRVTINLFPVQMVIFAIFCLLSMIFYIRTDCNRNRRLRIFMTTIAVSDTISIIMLIFIYIFLVKHDLKLRRFTSVEQCFYTPLECCLFLYYRFKTFFTFFVNLSLAISSWSVTMMLFDHLAGIKNPFGKQAQDRPVRTAYLTIIFVIFISFVFTVYHIFAFSISCSNNRNEMVPMQNQMLMRSFSLLNIFYQYVIPSIAMFVYIFLISYHIHKSQKVFSNRNEVSNSATRSLSTDGLRVHRGRRSNDSQHKVKIVPRMLVCIATNYLITNMPSAIWITKAYVYHAGQVMVNNKEYAEAFFLTNFCLISGKIMFYVIVFVSNAPRFWKFLGYFFGCRPDQTRLNYGTVIQNEDRRKLSKTSTARSDISMQEEKSMMIRRTQSNIVRQTKQKFSIQDQFEIHPQQESHSIHSFNMEKVSSVEKKNPIN